MSAGRRPLRTLLLYAAPAGSETLSYQRAWPRAFARSPAFDIDALDLSARGGRWRALVASRRRYDAVVLLHSVFSNESFLRGPALAAVARMRAPKAFFVGNEYKLMPEKMRFAERLGLTLLVTQLDAPEAHALYRDRLDCAVASIPYTGLEPDSFAPGPPLGDRPIDVGYRAHESPPYLGHRERRLLADDVAAAARARGLLVDASLDARDRFDDRGWAEFLRRCRAQLGSEAGGDYFELTDRTRLAVNAVLAEHPGTPFEEIHERFFGSYGPAVSGRALSGRVVDAAGTKTVQLLLEGRHGGYFEAGVHYVPLRHDLANLGEALDTLEDDEACRRLVDAAHEQALAHLTYPKLVDTFHRALTAAL